MSEKEITASSRKFYEKYHFPGNRPLDKDGLIFMRHFRMSVQQLRLRKNGNVVRVLDAGCGTGNTSIALAKQFSDIEFYAVDYSRESLKKARQIAKGNNLSNIRFRNCNLLNPLPYKSSFDIIICLGVLHHTANMMTVLRNLFNVLDRKGEFYLWIYARTGRYRHSLNMKLLKMLIDTGQAKRDEIVFASEFINKNKDSMLKDLAGTSASYLLKTSAAADPVWIADQYLNPHEELLDMEELLKLISKCGFVFCELLGMNTDISAMTSSVDVIKSFNNLTADQKLIALDLWFKPERYFIKMRKKGRGG